MSLQQLGGTQWPQWQQEYKEGHQLQALAHSPRCLGCLRKGLIKLDFVWPRLVGQRAICIGSNDIKNPNRKMMDFCQSVYSKLWELFKW